MTPADLAATIFTLLGIDPQLLLHTADGRPIHVSRDGRVVQELVRLSAASQEVEKGQRLGP